MTATTKKSKEEQARELLIGLTEDLVQSNDECESLGIIMQAVVIQWFLGDTRIPDRSALGVNGANKADEWKAAQGNWAHYVKLCSPQ